MPVKQKIAPVSSGHILATMAEMMGLESFVCDRKECNWETSCDRQHRLTTKQGLQDACAGCKNAVQPQADDPTYWDCSDDYLHNDGKCGMSADAMCDLHDIPGQFAILSHEGLYMGTAMVDLGDVRYAHPNIGYANQRGAKMIGDLNDPKTITKLSKWIRKVTVKRVEKLERDRIKAMAEADEAIKDLKEQQAALKEKKAGIAASKKEIKMAGAAMKALKELD